MEAEMATLTHPPEKRTRMTFYVREKEAKRLELLKRQAQEKVLTICFRDDFNKWLCQQLDQLEKSMKALLKEKGGQNG